MTKNLTPRILQKVFYDPHIGDRTRLEKKEGSPEKSVDVGVEHGPVPLMSALLDEQIKGSGEALSLLLTTVLGFRKEDPWLIVTMPG